MPEIKLTHVTKRWGKFYAVDDLSLDMEDNSFITLLGPSGCGGVFLPLPSKKLTAVCFYIAKNMV